MPAFNSIPSRLAGLLAAALLLLGLNACGGGASKLGVTLPPDTEQPTTLITSDNRIKAIIPPAAVSAALRLKIVNTSDIDHNVPGPDGRSLLMSVDFSAVAMPAQGADDGAPAEGEEAAPEPGEPPKPSLAQPVELRFRLQPALAPGLSLPIYVYNPVSERFETSSLSGSTSDDGAELVLSLDSFGRFAFYSLHSDELPPPAPTGLHLLAASTQVRRLAWEPVPGAAGYNLYRAAVVAAAAGTEPSFSKVNSSPLSRLEYSDQLSSPGDYLYRVCSLWPENESGQSLESLPSAAVSSPAVPFDVLFEFGGEPGSGVRRPTALALDPIGGRLFVADPLGGDVFIYGLDGQRLGAFFRYGASTAGAPTALACDPGLGRLYVADSALHCVFLLDCGVDSTTAPPYRLLGQFGQEGSAAGEFASPSAIALWRGEVAVADRGNDKLQLFTPLGVYLRTPAMAGSQDGQLMDPLALLPLSEGSLLIADHGNQRLAGFGDDGAPSSPIVLDAASGGPLSPAGLAEDFRGQIYVSDPPQRRVLVLDSGGAPLFSFGSEGSLLVEFGASGPAGLAYDPLSGYLYVCDPDNSRILVFSS